jgi:hypothetical protein
MDFQKKQGRGTKTYEDTDADISRRAKKFGDQSKMIMRGIVFGTGTDATDTGGKIRLPGDKLPPKEDDSSGKSKTKKAVEKQASLLELIVQNTSKANELTLRNLTYGGGMLAAEGVSAVQMANYRTVSSPRINATNDINRGIKKEVNATVGSNFLNFSPRRS